MGVLEHMDSDKVHLERFERKTKFQTSIETSKFLNVILPM